jgi:hypothetical protein
LKEIAMGMRPFTSHWHKSSGQVKLEIVPRSFMMFQKSDSVFEREIGRREVFKEIDFSMQEILKGGTVGDYIIKSGHKCWTDKRSATCR